jgi:hypothetical protein
MSLRRPILSMTVRAAMVATRFMKPTATLIRNGERPPRRRPSHHDGGVVEDRVDAGHLVEHGDHEGEHDDLGMCPLVKNGTFGVLLAACSEAWISLDLEIRLSSSGGAAADDREIGPASSRRPVRHQPARRLGHGEQQPQEDHRRDGHDAEHPAPVGRPGRTTERMIAFDR